MYLLIKYTYLLGDFWLENIQLISFPLDTIQLNSKLNFLGIGELEFSRSEVDLFPKEDPTSSLISYNPLPEFDQKYKELLGKDTDFCSADRTNTFSDNADKNKTNDLRQGHSTQGSTINNRITVQGSGSISMSKEDAEIIRDSVQLAVNNVGLGASIGGVSSAVAYGLSKTPVSGVKKTALIALGGILGGVTHVGATSLNQARYEAALRIREESRKANPGSGQLYQVPNPGETGESPLKIESSTGQKSNIHLQINTHSNPDLDQSYRSATQKPVPDNFMSNVNISDNSNTRISKELLSIQTSDADDKN